MSKHRAIPSGLLARSCLMALMACGGEAKHADAPGACPDGTMLKGDDCVPESAVGGKAIDDSVSPKASTKHDDGAPSASASDSAGGAGASYDKDAVETQLKRAAKQIKENCGSASDEEGNKTGPWGPTTAAIVLGRNGHIADVTVPAPYNGKPVGDCVARSFKKIQFPPYAAASDVTINWDIVIAEPKRK